MFKLSYRGRLQQFAQQNLWIPKTTLSLSIAETIKNYRERIRQAERAGEFALSEALRDIIAQEQDHEIDLKDALGLR